MAGEDNKPVAMAASTGYCYSDIASSSETPNIQIHIMNQLQSFASNPEIYSLTSGMDMIGFPTKNISHQHITDNNSVLWNKLLVEDPSLRSLFPCDGNQRPSQGLSLSLTSSNPSTIGLQSFQLKQNDDLRFGPSSSRSLNIQQTMQEQFHIRTSKYLEPAQELLNEFCNLGTNQTDETSKITAQKRISEQKQQDDAVKMQSPHSLNILELQKRKTKLLQMLEEVDRRYKHYHVQMKAVVSSFEAVAGNGAARVYSATASRAMSQHFRFLRDGIVNQIKAMRKAMGEKDAATPITMKGETPRLKILDQKLRQRRALQQMTMMENHPWRPQRGLPERSVAVLRSWLFEHFLHPYPSDVDKHILARQTGLSRSQVSNWFINARVRIWKPMVEEMYLEDLKEDKDATNFDENDKNPSTHEDNKKPTQDQLMIRMDSECLSSIINTAGENNKALQNDQQQHSFIRVGNGYDATQFDFSSYNHHALHRGAVSYLHENTAPLGGGGVSLTLGLQQHGENGEVSLAFSQASQSTHFYPRDQMGDCQTVQYSLFDSENQNLPYRSLMGAQLLRDLAG